jgi:hypothetical protein
LKEQVGVKSEWIFYLINNNFVIWVFEPSSLEQKTK